MTCGVNVKTAVTDTLTMFEIIAISAIIAVPWRGVDISQLSTEDANGTQSPFRRSAHDNTTIDALQLLKSSGANALRMRMWNEPCADGRCDAQRYSYAGLAGVLAMARRCYAVGLDFILDLHYSDWWADPGQQRKPAAWTSLDMDDLVRALHNFTAATVSALVAQGTAPRAVQIGNEINDGLLWSNASLGQPCAAGGELFWCSDGGSARPVDEAWGTVGRLVAAGISAVRATSPASLVAIHTGGNNIEKKGIQWFGDWYANLSRALTPHDAHFDLVGLSLYPKVSRLHADCLPRCMQALTTACLPLHPKMNGGTTFASIGQLPQLARGLPLSTRIYIAETAYPAAATNASAPPPERGYAASEAGQLAFLRDVQASMASALGERNGGVLWWEGSERCWDCLFGSGDAPDLTPLFVARPALLHGFSSGGPVEAADDEANL